MTNDELYGFHGISVWLAESQPEAEQLIRTKLSKFDRYAEFAVADVVDGGLQLWPTGQSPHYDVVHEDGLDADQLVDSFARVLYRVRQNPYVDREES